MGVQHFWGVHTCKRNHLSNAAGEKLVFISQNLKFVAQAEDGHKLPGLPGECGDRNTDDSDECVDDPE